MALLLFAACGPQAAEVETRPELSVPAWPQGFPADFPDARVSGDIPLSVPLPDNIEPNDQVRIRPYFDYFSWQSFIALNWPAVPDQRGVPDEPDNPNVFLEAGVGTPVVWGTYKESFELFGQGDNRPTPFDSYDEPVNPCPGGTDPAQKTLTFVSKGNNVIMETQQAFSYPLIDQRSNPVHYEVRYNQAQYDFVRGADNDQSSWLYLVSNLADKEPLQMPSSHEAVPAQGGTPAAPAELGSVMVKAAWRVQTGQDDPSRFFASEALIHDPGTGTCKASDVLLVGLHIAHKVDPFTEWVWSTFEQVDNVPSTAAGASPSPPPHGYSFNNGRGEPETDGGYDYRPPLDAGSGATPVQVTRLNPIPDSPAGRSTLEVNAYYQRLLAGTPWENYQLVVTQWPFNFSRFVTPQAGGVYPQDSGGAFPVNGAVNTTLETYFQDQNDAAGAGGNSCMSCHYQAAESDYSWGLNRRAH
jgi:hypothetical protein